MRYDYHIAYPLDSSAITIPITGTHQSQTIGWHAQASPAILFPSTAVAAASILIILYINLILAQDNPIDRAGFDPSAALDLMAVASAGGMNGMFDDLDKWSDSASPDPRVKFGTIGKINGLVRADTYTVV
jgi:hypothetical protein